ncbi:MAG: endo-1,4-beta-xylanase [Bacteroidales bacterium]|nr:endo-1,4-beta-xylanase [Bacteroidales bacterium]
MRNILPLLALGLLTACAAPEPQTKTLREAFDGQFLMGCAINVDQSSGRDVVGDSLIVRHFNSIVAENCMKCELIHPEPDRYNWEDADRFVEFGEKHGMTIIGHCLIWHSQCAPWFFVDEKGDTVSAEVLQQRIKDHIQTIVGRYKGRIRGWDVVNEAILDDGTYRQSPFYRIMGDSFIPWALACAHEADPDAELYLNDYSMAKPAKRQAYVDLVATVQASGLRLDAIGMQAHAGMDYPDMTEMERSMQAFIGQGVDVQFTELDVNALPNVFAAGNENAAVENNFEYNQRMNPYPDGLPDSVQTAWNGRVQALFDLALKYSAHVRRVTVWGVYDQQSWLNDWPMHGRTNYPLLFDRQYRLKPVMDKYLTASAQ